MNALENRIPPPIVTGVMGVAMWLGVRFLPLAHFENPNGLILGGMFLILGIACLALGAGAFRHAKTTIDPVRIDRASSLVTSGIFKYTRNPMYVGFTCILLAWAIVLSSAWALLGPILFVVYIQRFQIAPEERVMQSKFGKAFAEYRLRTRRWV